MQVSTWTRSAVYSSQVTLSLLVSLLSSLHTAGASTLETVRARGTLLCGVSQGLQGFSKQDERGNWAGFDVDLCRAIAAAVLGDQSLVTFVPLSAESRFQALREDQIDILSRNTTWTMTRDLEFGLTFPAITYYDGQGFMLPEALGIASVRHLSGAKVCVVSGTTTEENIASHFAGAGMVQSVATYANRAEALKHYVEGDCDAFSADRSALFADRLSLSEPSEHMVLPEIISKEPLGPAIRDGDDQWASIVRWTFAALVNAEELKLTRSMVVKMVSPLSTQQQSFLQNAGRLGEQLGLADQWAVNVIAAVGNYGEIFDRNVGSQSELQIVRGLNALWDQGGLIYAPPMR